jgi:transposase
MTSAAFKPLHREVKYGMSAEIPQGFVSAGFDCHKEQHTLAILDQDGRLVGQRETIPITNAGFEHTRQLLLAAMARSNAETVRIGIEAASFYHLNITAYLQQHFKDIRIYNPKLLVRGEHRREIRYKKTDRQDALNIAMAVRENIPGTMPYGNPALLEIQELCRLNSRLIKNRTNLMKRFRRNLDVLFPGFDNIVKPFSRTGTKLLMRYPSADTVRTASVEELKATTLAGGVRSMREGKIKAVIELAKTIPDCQYYREALILEQKILLKDILSLSRQINGVSREVRARWPGIGIKPAFFGLDGMIEERAIALYAETGRIDRFCHVDKLVAFFGLDPRTKRSDTHVTYGRLTKMGTRYGREILGNLVMSMRKTNPAIKKAWEKAVRQRRPKKVCRVIAMRKLARIIWGIEHNSRPQSMV